MNVLRQIFYVGRKSDGLENIFQSGIKKHRLIRMETAIEFINFSGMNSPELQKLIQTKGSQFSQQALLHLASYGYDVAEFLDEKNRKRPVRVRDGTDFQANVQDFLKKQKEKEIKEEEEKDAFFAKIRKWF